MTEVSETQTSRIQEGMDGPTLLDGGKQGILFLVDMQSKMFEEDEDGKIPFRVALQAIRNQMNAISCTGDLKELVSLVLFNSPVSNQKHGEFIFVHRAFDNLDVEYVKVWDGILAKDDLQKEIEKQVGAEGTGECDFVDLLTHCQDVLTGLRKKNIFVFTVNNDPLQGDKKALDKVRTRVRDVRDKGASIAVFIVGKTNKPIAKIWQVLDPDVRSSGSLEELQANVKRKNYALRATTSIPLTFGGSLQIAVGVYHLIKEQSKPTPLKVDAETNKTVELKTHYVPADSDAAKGEDMTPIEELEAQRFEGELGFTKTIGGVTIVLSRTEVENLRRFDKPGIVILGFKPLSCLKPSHRMAPSQYLFPLNEIVGGSGNLYRALHQRCLERELYAVVRYTQKTNTPPQLAALIAQPAALSNEDNESDLSQHLYEGFHLIELPFAEDKRDLSARKEPPGQSKEWPSATADQINAAKAFVDRLTAPFTPDQFTNPVLQQYYKGLEVQALDEPTDKFDKEVENIDQIKPYFKTPELAQRAEKELEQYMKACGGDENAPQTKAKRPRKK
jgi:ATP-dependent DNA helicase 2 subunit 1